MNFVTKLLRRLRSPADPEAAAEAQRMRAEREAARDKVRADAGPRGIPGLPPDDDLTDPRR